MWRGLIILADYDAVTGTLITFERRVREPRANARLLRREVRGEPRGARARHGPRDDVLAAAGDLCDHPTQPFP